MRFAMKSLEKIYNKGWNIRHDVYLWLKRLRLKNRDFSIISSNCVGGVMSHDLKERFNSPTVNLWFKPDDFFTFIGDLDYYLSAEVVEAFEDGIDYPIGRIYRGETFVTIYFMHYGSFDKAVKKWNERADRVRKNNMYVVFEYPAIDDTPEEQAEMKRKFDSIHYDNKIMITKESDLSGDNIVHMRFYDKIVSAGGILKYKNKFSVKRYLDDYDYVSFLNSGKEK
ncbi:MAG: DUF1919 domain-containing protein [Clostridia bacterium]|nr:DUF1919 domain-containing protein [Clostridia bacterium]